MSSADVCGFCQKKISARPGSGSIRVVRGNSISVTVFRCVNAACTHRFHASCVREQLGTDASIIFDCPHCRTRCTAHAPSGVISSALRAMWRKYPTLLPGWYYATFFLNRCFDLAAFVVGLMTLVVFYSLVPYTDDPSLFWPSVMQRETAEHIAYTVMPEQLRELRHQATDSGSPTLAVATCVAAWIFGWVLLSLWLRAQSTVWSIIRRKNSYQTAQGVILE